MGVEKEKLFYSECILLSMGLYFHQVAPHARIARVVAPTPGSGWSTRTTPPPQTVVGSGNAIVTQDCVCKCSASYGIQAYTIGALFSISATWAYCIYMW